MKKKTYIELYETEKGAASVLKWLSVSQKQTNKQTKKRIKPLRY